MNTFRNIRTGLTTDLPFARFIAFMDFNAKQAHRLLDGHSVAGWVMCRGIAPEAVAQAKARRRAERKANDALNHAKRATRSLG